MRKYLGLFTKSLGICGCLLLLTLAAGMGMARARGLQFMSVESGSMAPLIKKGDAVIVDRRADNFKTGMIVSYESPRDAQVTITHRIVAIDRVRGTIRTKGDNLMTPDPAVPMSAVQGTVRYHLRYAGALLEALRRPLGLALVVYLPATGIIASELWRLQRYYSGSGAGRYLLYGY